jgi:hypothetical protein
MDRCLFFLWLRCAFLPDGATEMAKHARGEIMTDKLPEAKIIHFGIRGITVKCPYCKGEHSHNYPLGEGIRMAECMKGEYQLVK